MSAETVPFLAPARIEAAATKLLDAGARTLGARIEPPVPVDALVELQLGLTLEIDDLARALGRPEVLGATWLEKPGRIVLDRSLHPDSGRFFFTLAHEAGHWVLHRDLAAVLRAGAAVDDDSVAPSIVCVDPAVDVGRPRIEVQADRFAAALLMPAVFVRDAVRRVRAEEADVPAGEFVDLVRDVGCFTNVSRQALSIRLRTLGLSVAVMSVADGG